MLGRQREAALDVYKLALGAFVFVSPWLFALRYEAARLDSMIAGGLVVLLAVIALAAYADWEEWAALGLGMWLIASPAILGFPTAAGMKIHIGAGLLLAYLALLELWLVHYGDEPR